MAGKKISQLSTILSDQIVDDDLITLVDSSETVITEINKKVTIEQFNTFLNGVDDQSLQAQLNNADCDTLFNGISKSETKKISRIAQDLSALVESLKGYLLSSDADN